jgi:copper chaperone
MSTTYAVTGMTCEHCVRAVSSEVETIEGVTAVAVDLGTGQVTIEGYGFDHAQVAAAVDEAGYALARDDVGR